MDMIEKKSQLNTLVNELLDDYIINSENVNIIKKEKLEESIKYNENIKNLSDEIKSRDYLIETITKQLKNANKTKVDYEKVINGLNDKIEEVSKEVSGKNRHDIIKVQARELDEKDRVIEQLQNKILKLSKQPDNKVKFKLNELVNEQVHNTNDEIPDITENFDEVIDTNSEQTCKVEPEKVEPEKVEKVEPEKVESEKVESEKVEKVEPEKVECEKVESEKVEVYPDEESEGEDEDDEVWLKIKHKGVQYIIVQGENPQNVYKIEDDDSKGKRVGTRTDGKNGRKKYKFD